MDQYRPVTIIDQFSFSKLLDYDGIYKIRELTKEECSLFWSNETLSGLSHFVSHGSILHKLNECGARYYGEIRHLGLLDYEQAFVIFTENWRGDYGKLTIKLISKLPNQEVKIPEEPKPGKGEGLFFSNRNQRA